MNESNFWSLLRRTFWCCLALRNAMVVSGMSDVFNVLLERPFCFCVFYVNYVCDYHNHIIF